MAVVSAASGDDYYGLLLGLRPTGPAWPSDDPLLQAIADGLARVHNRALGLLDEADSRTTLEMLPAWERNAGLPDACTGPAVGLAERRRRLAAQITARGGQSRAFFIGLAASMGYPGCTITEFAAFTCGSACSAALNTADVGWPHAWRLNVPVRAGAYTFTATSGCDEALRAWGSAVLECVVRRAAPAHTVALFGYLPDEDWLRDGGAAEDWGTLDLIGGPEATEDWGSF
ncbi:YmfQ family protein [Azospirillum tabaci]|uniref:YmfQ family protein n=1 Tax=Azospirillum tabaci TaxID=2752310 RepID=UPI0016617300|nr:putative phage tail protein [Azospirillum tabaci]